MDIEFEERLAAAQAVAFTGETLAPFFLQNPKTGSAGAMFAAMASLDVDAAADEWPFADPAQAREALSLMVEGLAPSMADGAACGGEGDGAALFRADDALTDEYRRLFIGPAPKPAPPWGSVYTDRECVVFGESTLALRAWMRANGITRLSDERTPEDHIGLMLALLAHIARMHTSLIEEYLRDHLLTWAPHFLGQLSQAACHPFYRGLSDLTLATLLGMRETFSIDVVEPRFYR